MLSKSCQYAIRSLLYIARNGKEGRNIELKEIAEGLEIPGPFLAKVMQQLAKRRLVRSVKGPNGGFYLTAKEKKKSLLDVMEAIDGLGHFTRCGLGMDECSASNPCPVHQQVAKVNSIMKKSLQKNSIEKIERKIREGEYVIFR